MEWKSFGFYIWKKPHSIKYIGKKANNDICKYNLRGINKTFASQITKINFKDNYWEIKIKDGSNYQFKYFSFNLSLPTIKKKLQENI